MIKITNYESFMAAIKELDITVGYSKETSLGDYLNSLPINALEIQDKAFIGVEWTTGGQIGGNWKGGRADTPVSPEPEPEFEHLDKILLTLTPDIKLTSYKDLVKQLVVREDDTRREYYGNYTEFSTKSVQLPALYHYLVSNSILMVNTIVFLVGLPGAGKTTYAKKHYPDYSLFDDLSVMSDGKQRLTKALKNNVNCVVTDMSLCFGDNRTHAADLVKDIGCNQEWIFFRNDPKNSQANVLRRQRAGDSRSVDDLIRIGTKMYVIPVGATVLETYHED